MNEDEEKYAAAVAHQSGMGLSQLQAPQTPYNMAQSYIGSGFANDVHCRSTALEVAMRLTKPSETFLDVMGRARAIYQFLTEKMETGA